jgi:predicted Zn-dependent protease
MIIDRLEQVLKSLDGEIELSVKQQRQGTTRFANNVVTQSGDVEDVTIQARVAVGKRVGTARTNRWDGIAEAVARARQLASPADFAGFDDGRPAPEAAPWFDEEVAGAGAARRAELVAPALSRSGELGLTAAGLGLTSVNEVAVVTTAGARRHWRWTLCKLDVIADGARLGRCGSHFFDADDLVERVCERALRAKNPIEVPAGRYDVILEPPALAEMLEWLASTSLAARAVEDGSSCLAGRAGERIAGEVTLYDDALSGDCPTAPFDSQGTPRQKLTFLDGGVARGPAHDRASALRAGAASTGHAAPLADEIFETGPAPQHLHLAPGSDTLDTLLSRVERGLYVARFHYVNGLVDTRRALMTGMTRDGLFLVENGQITRPVRNLRWTESLLDAFTRCGGMTQSRELVASPLVEFYSVVPAILVRDWSFG